MSKLISKPIIKKSQNRIVRFVKFSKCEMFFFSPFPDAPRCKPGTEQSSVGSINMHSIDVRCEVDADPAEHVRFSWTYNNTRNVSPVSQLFFIHLQIKWRTLSIYKRIHCAM